MNLKIDSPLVSVEWLLKNIEAENLIILNGTIKKVGKSKEKHFEEKQIKGAVFFDLKKVFSLQEATYPNTILSPEEFEIKARSIGVSKDSCIVVYDDLGIYSSARVWWLFKTMGFDNIAVLNGGLPEWKSKGGRVEKNINNVKKNGDFKVSFVSGKVCYTKDVLALIDVNDTKIIDARSSGRFYATEPEPREDLRRGHIPNSLSLPYKDLQEEGKMKSFEELEVLLKGINPQRNKMIFSCGSGITACILALAAEIVNYKDYSVYDGSWTEWGSREDLPIEK